MTKAKYATTAFEGVGAGRAGGRWNTPGRAVVYCSEHPATAALEVLVHLKRAQVLRDYVIVSAEVPDAHVQGLDLTALPERWDALEETTASTDIGDAWFGERVSVGLRVPSVVMAGQFNVLFNPLHPNWSSVQLGEAHPFRFDPRLAS